MDSTSEIRTLDEIADMLVENLTRSGKLADLGNANLETIENEVLENMDDVTRDAISKLLRLVSVNVALRRSNSPSVSPVITPDASVIVFQSSATEFVMNDFNGRPDLYALRLIDLPNTTISVDDGASSTAGSTLVYTISYANAGNLDATGVVIADSLPDGTFFDAVSRTPGWIETAPGSGVYRLVVGNLAAGASGSAKFAVTVVRPLALRQSRVTNTVTIADDGASGADIAPDDNVATDDTMLVDPNLFAIGADAGAGPHVRVFNGDGPHEKFGFYAYSRDFTGGVRVAVGDVTGDGTPDVITAAGPGGGPHVRVFDGITAEQVPGAIGSFYAYDPAFTGGVFVTAADFNGDGLADIVTGADAGGGPHVRVFSGRDGTELVGFFDDSKAGGGVRVATGDIDGDGTPDIIAAGAPDSVRVFSGLSGREVEGAAGRISAYPGFGGGVYVAGGDVNGDGRDDVITGAGAGGGPHVRAFSGVDGSELASFFAYDAAFTGGVRVGTGDVDQDGDLEIITGAGPGGGPHVRAFDVLADGEVASFFAFDPAFGGGVFVAGSPIVETAPSAARADSSPVVWLIDGVAQASEDTDATVKSEVQPALSEVDADNSHDRVFTGPDSLSDDWSADEEWAMFRSSAGSPVPLDFSWPELADLLHTSESL